MICSKSSNISSDHPKTFLLILKTEMSDDLFKMSNDLLKIIRYIVWWSKKLFMDTAWAVPGLKLHKIQANRICNFIKFGLRASWGSLNPLNNHASTIFAYTDYAFWFWEYFIIWNMSCLTCSHAHKWDFFSSTCWLVPHMQGMTLCFLSISQKFILPYSMNIEHTCIFLSLL